MPKNTVNDPITDQEIAFALLVLSGTTNDRAAAEAVGLNPDTASYTKSKPRVRDYMIEHRAAVKEKLVDQESQGLRKLNLGRDQILARLWELATLSHEVTRGNIAGQIKAISLIVAIEGLIPGRIPSPSGTQPAATPFNAQTYSAQWLREQQEKAARKDPGNTVAPGARPTGNHGPLPENAPHPTPSLDRPQLSVANPFVHPIKLNPVPAATDFTFETVLDTINSLRLPFSPAKHFSGPARRGR
jgi:hypothetical protein